MRTYELLREETITDYVQRLTRELEIKSLGSGLFSYVFQHNTDPRVAVKLVVDNPSYVRFARFCMENEGNRWLPRIFSIVPVSFTAGKWSDRTKLPTKGHVIFIERLSRATDAFIRKTALDVVAALPEEAFAGEVFTKAISSFIDLGKKEWKAIARFSEDEDLRAAARYFATRSVPLDIHNENVMVRRGGKPQLVFNDPVAEWPS